MDDETRDLTSTWHRVQAALPKGWTLDGLRCASHGLTEGQLPDDWIAVAVGRLLISIE
jgi:hypothetical protein